MTRRPMPLFVTISAIFLACMTPAAAQKAPETPPAPTKPGESAPAPAPETPAPAPAPAAPQPLPVEPAQDVGLSGVLETLVPRLQPGDLDDFHAALTESPADALGHLMYLRRHVAPAAWFFGTEAARDATDAAALSNFAAMLYELSAMDPANAEPSWLPVAHAAARNAALLRPDSAPIQNTLGNLARATGDAAEAIAAGERATSLAPDEALYWTNLARSHEAAGALDAAAAALARAHALDPNGPAVRFTAAALPSVAAPYGQHLATQCDVDFRCQEICPRSIIGGLMSVTCEMENMSAQLACQEGRPYPTSYNCQEDFPEYGILIPGLNSGFSVSLPGFSMHVLVDGNGDVRVRVEGGISRGRVGVYAGADGTWSPTNGASFDQFRGGVRVNILPTAIGGGSAVDEAAGAWGHPPAHIELEGNSSGQTTLGAEAYNAGLISN